MPLLGSLSTIHGSNAGSLVAIVRVPAARVGSVSGPQSADAPPEAAAEPEADGPAEPVAAAEVLPAVPLLDPQDDSTATVTAAATISSMRR